MLLHDTHDRRVIEDVWQLLDLALVKFGPHPVILERDDDEVSLAEILDELCLGIGRGNRHNIATSVFRAADSAPGARN